MIRHTALFKLKHAPGSQGEADFLRALAKLAEVPGVNKFERLRQISKKTDYDFGVSMEFASLEDYQAYSAHDIHVGFVETYWLPEVADFMEVDYEPYEEG